MTRNLVGWGGTFREISRRTLSNRESTGENIEEKKAHDEKMYVR